MTEETDSIAFQSIAAIDHIKLSELITKNRKLYISYNILRLRELIRYLSPAKLDLFNTIPLMLHLNYPDFPGYVSPEAAVHGIVNFQKSGFYVQALEKNRLEDSVVQPYTTNTPLILSLFHIGSAGTLTQSEKSDFDYWVIVDKERIDDHRLSLLQKKLSQIEKYCYEHFKQEVTFFVHDASHIRNNDFATVEVSSYGLAPKTLLKEEFYRTFIMIAGKIPYWAVFPSNLTDEEYSAYVNYIHTAPWLQSIKNDYVDLGNLFGIDTGECLGVILWQILKAKEDPVKSLVKASLIANYYFFQDKDHPLLCNTIKNHFHEALLDNYHLDPYALVFKTIYEFYKNMTDSYGVELIKTAIFLRLCGFPFVSLPDEESPKRLLLKRYVKEWRMDRKTVTRLLSYKRWPERDKLALDEEIFKKLSFLYELILRNQDEKLIGIEMNAFDLSILKNRTAAFLTKKPGKIPRCSTWLEKMRGRLMLLVTERCPTPSSGWYVYGSAKRPTVSFDSLLFQDPDFLKVVGWVIANRLNPPAMDSISFEDSMEDPFSEHDRKAWFEELSVHMTQEDRSDESSFLKDPSWLTLYLLLKPGRQSGHGFPSGIDLLVKNTWDEYYFDSVDLSYIVKESEKWYKISSVIWAYLVKSPHFALKYQLASAGGEEVSGIAEAVSEILRQFMEVERKKKGQTENRGQADPVEPLLLDARPFLDVIE